MKGFADYLCEEIRREERNIARDIEKKERREARRHDRLALKIRTDRTYSVPNGYYAPEYFA